MRVVDSSVVVAALTDRSDTGAWAESIVFGDRLAAPALMHFEAANVIRRLVSRGAITPFDGAAALADLTALSVAVVPFEFVVDRSWELRHTVTMYDAAFVAAAEAFLAPLYTLDRRLAAAPGPMCPIITPPGA